MLTESTPIRYCSGKPDFTRCPFGYWRRNGLRLRADKLSSFKSKMKKSPSKGQVEIDRLKQIEFMISTGKLHEAAHELNALVEIQRNDPRLFLLGSLLAQAAGTNQARCWPPESALVSSSLAGCQHSSGGSPWYARVIT